MLDRAHDAAVRNAAFDWLRARADLPGDVLPRTLLAAGFTLDGVRVPLLGPQGIFKPKVLSAAPLSITTAPDGPYDDAFGPNDLLRYHYRGTDPDHPDNQRVRVAMRERLPLVYFHGVVPGKYLAAWPVFVVGDDRPGLTFTIAVDDARHLWPAIREQGVAVRDDLESGRRQYVTAAVRQRLHQRAFRERVLHAYRIQPALHRPGSDAERLPAGGLLDGLEVQTVGCTGPYKRFDFGIDFGRDLFLKAPFFSASAPPPRRSDSRVWHSASLTSINSPVRRRKR